MYVVMVASELAPVAKVGGLADVVLGLSRAIEQRGNAVEIILPKYDCMQYQHIEGLQPNFDLWVPWHNGDLHCTIWFGYVHGCKCYFVEPHSDDHYFERGTFYGFDDDAARFAFFTKAALEFLYKSQRRPHVIHTHDWQTGLLAPILFEIYGPLGMNHVRACHTIHNFKHQGTAGNEILTATGLGRPEYFFSSDRLVDDHNPFAINFTKSAIVYSNFVTTVSPKHAWEARFTEHGHGLGHTLHRHQDKFGGVLNGIDYDIWNPQLDPHIPVPFHADDFEGKYGNKRALRQRLWLADSYAPIVAYVGRLDAQKGLPLIRHALRYSLANGCQFVLLGTSPEQAINDQFWQLKRELNDDPNCHLEIGFDERLAHQIYAGADIIVVPSMFEPCGLTQMIALRYGTVPVVRAVGGLVDTVFDRDHAGVPPEQRNGYTFEHPDPAGLESALHRAIGLWNSYPDQFRALAIQGMRQDYSWNGPAGHYLNIYELIRDK